MGSPRGKYCYKIFNFYSGIFLKEQKPLVRVIDPININFNDNKERKTFGGSK